MGDVIHALPVVSDMRSALPGVEIDWVVEEAFAQLPCLHPGVRETVPVAVRRWRKAPFSRAVRAEVGAVREHLKARRYDLAVDLQGLLKSAWLSRLSGAPIAGFDWSSAREPLATLWYRHRYRVGADLHAIERLRHLAGQALNYSPQGLPRFDLSAPVMAFEWCPPAPYVVLLHATSRAEKLWPADHWTDLACELMAAGVSVVLPWGSLAEQQQAQALAAAMAHRQTGAGAGPAAAVVAPRLTLSACAALLASAAGVVGVDTGLTHLAAALSRPTVALFAATPGWRYGPYWSDRAASLGSAGVWPAPDEVLQALRQLTEVAAGRGGGVLRPGSAPRSAPRSAADSP